MDSLFTYLIKSSTILGIFYCCYVLLLKNETFFKANRHFLIGGMFLSLIIPFIIIEQVIWVTEEISINNLSFVNDSNITNNNINPTTIYNELDLNSIVLYFYCIGLAFFTLRLLIQLWSVYKKINSGTRIQQGNLTLVTCKETTSPFSFFNTIVFNKDAYTSEELALILKHEKAHCEQKHSIDIILMQVILIILWFNPFAWLYLKAIQQNLEFLADETTIERNKAQLSNYQNLLIKSFQLEYQPNTIINNFNQTLIKKRILMLNHQQTQQQRWKLVIIIPLLVSFIFLFNTETIAQVKKKNKPTTTKNQTCFILPIHLSNKVSITSGFGERYHPINKEKKMHNGVDYKAPIGTPVFAASNGKVVFADKKGNYGNLIILEHNDGYTTKYGQLQEIKVKLGDKITAGTIIGTVGNTGLSTGPHLHFEILKDNVAVNPTSYVNTEKATTKHTLFEFSKSTTDDQLRIIESYFAENFDQTKIQFNNIKRNNKGEIIAYTFATKMSNQHNFTNRFSRDCSNTIKSYTIVPSEESIVFLISNETKESFKITDKDLIRRS